MPHFIQICFFTCQLCFCTGVPFQTSTLLLSTSSCRSSLWSCNCPSRSLTSQLLWKSPLWPLEEPLLNSWNMDESSLLPHPCSFFPFTSNTSHLWCAASSLLELVIRKELSHTWIPWKKKKEVLLGFFAH